MAKAGVSRYAPCGGQTAPQAFLIFFSNLPLSNCPLLYGRGPEQWAAIVIIIVVLVFLVFEVSATLDESVEGVLLWGFVIGVGLEDVSDDLFDGLLGKDVAFGAVGRR